MTMFDDLLDANRSYQSDLHDGSVAGKPARRLAVVTCMDTRIDPLAVLGLRPGDAKITRNAGARVTDDALRCLILATNLLDCDRICVIAHSRCAMAGSTEDEMRAQVEEASGASAAAWEFLSTTDQVAALRADVQRIRDCPLIADSVEIGAFVFDVDSGALDPVEI